MRRHEPNFCVDATLFGFLQWLIIMHNRTKQQYHPCFRVFYYISQSRRDYRRSPADQVWARCVWEFRGESMDPGGAPCWRWASWTRHAGGDARENLSKQRLYSNRHSVNLCWVAIRARPHRSSSGYVVDWIWGMVQHLLLAGDGDVFVQSNTRVWHSASG